VQPNLLNIWSISVDFGWGQLHGHITPLGHIGNDKYLNLIIGILTSALVTYVYIYVEVHIVTEFNITIGNYKLNKWNIFLAILTKSCVHHHCYRTRYNAVIYNTPIRVDLTAVHLRTYPSDECSGVCWSARRIGTNVQYNIIIIIIWNIITLRESEVYARDRDTFVAAVFCLHNAIDILFFHNGYARTDLAVPIVIIMIHCSLEKTTTYLRGTENRNACPGQTNAVAAAVCVVGIGITPFE